jgi:4'-phosphopantetheinyl transferase
MLHEGHLRVTMPDHIQPLPPHAAGRLWLVSLLDEPLPEHWQACNADEHARAGRFKFELHARRYRAAHAALRLILSGALNLPAKAIEWRVGTHGKPHLSGAITGWHMNMSHSEDWALIGLSEAAPIGVDIECAKPLADLDQLAAQHFTPLEQAALGQAGSAAFVMGFYELWCRKEACLKALGSGLTIEPQRFECGLGAGAGQASRVHIHGGADVSGGQAHQALAALSVWTLGLPHGVPAAVARLETTQASC